jgi:hypothetical protein
MVTGELSKAARLHGGEGLIATHRLDGEIKWKRGPP